MELMLGRMGELPYSTKDWKIGRFQEYVAFAMRVLEVSPLRPGPDVTDRRWKLRRNVNHQHIGKSFPGREAEFH